MKVSRFICALCVAVAVVSCSVKEEVAVESDAVIPMVITIDLDGAGTKTTYDFETGRMRTHWEDGDAVFASPVGRSDEGSIYRVPAGGAASNTFVADKAITYKSTQHFFFYPGDKIINDPQFMLFSYEGQVQKKSDPLGHLSRFHSMRQYVYPSQSSADYDVSHVSFAGCTQSGCMRFILSGATFKNPKSIELQLLEAGQPQTVFYDKNYLASAFKDTPSGMSNVWPSRVSSLSIGLEGYGTESQIVAYMMHGCKDVPLPAGSSLRVIVRGDEVLYADVPISKDDVIKGGYCSSLSISEGWKKDSARDGEVVTLQERSDGKGVDVVIMGDGFIEEDFENGTYQQMMLKIYQELFSVEPYASLKDAFNVYYVNAVSPERIDAVNTGSNGAKNGTAVTKFMVQFKENSTHMSGDNELARTYAKKAFKTNASTRIKDATILMVANHKCHAGTCSSSITTNSPYDYGQSSSVAYFAIGRTDLETVQVIHHEGNGHGIGKLGDEYYSNSSFTFTQSLWTNLETSHSRGLSRNVDKYVTANFNSMFPDFATTPTRDDEVLWYDLIGTRNHYESSSVESLGIFEGGKTYRWGFCRPTQTSSRSIMISNAGIFNAICRRQILYRVRYLSGEITSNIWGTPAELEYFLQWDAEHFLNKLSTTSVPASLSKDNYSDEMLMPYAPQEFEEGEWVDGEFIPKATSGKLF